MGIFWLVLVIAFAVIEAVTYQLVSIWFAGGAVAALIAHICGGSQMVQWVVFVAVSAVLMAVSRPLVKKLRKKEPEKMNADRLIGKIAHVTAAADRTTGNGQAVVNGMTWTVRSADGAEIAIGDDVVIEKIEGVKLIVRK